MKKNPVIVEPNLDKLFETLSTSSKRFYVFYYTFYSATTQLKKYCNLMKLYIPSIDENFPWTYYIKRKGVSKEISERLDLALMTLRSLSDQV